MKYWKNFNSRPSARGDYGFCNPQIRNFISIHAPPRGATDVEPEGNAAFLISIHAPPRGATMLVLWISARNLFQFTPLREGRLDLFRNAQNAAKISIHAPPRGATAIPPEGTAIYCISIHAPPRGATCTSISTPAVFLFQFTPLREGRLY